MQQWYNLSDHMYEPLLDEWCGVKPSSACTQAVRSYELDQVPECMKTHIFHIQLASAGLLSQ